MVGQVALSSACQNTSVGPWGRRPCLDLAKNSGGRDRQVNLLKLYDKHGSRVENVISSR